MYYSFVLQLRMSAKTKQTILRLAVDLRTRLDDEAEREGTTLSDLLRRLIEHRYGTPGFDPFSATQTVPKRILEVEGWFGLSALESAQSLSAFGIGSFADLKDGEKLLEGITRPRLEAFAKTYEVKLAWLLTGEGSVNQATHVGWYPFEVASRISRLWLESELVQVLFVANQEPSVGRGRTFVQVVLAKKHPHPRLSNTAGELLTVNESFPVVIWEQNDGGLWQLVNLILFCRKLYTATHRFEVFPRGETLPPNVFDALRSGQLHLAQALQKMTFSWDAEVEAKDMNTATRTDGASADWEVFEALAERTLVAWQGRKELSGGRV